MGMDVVLAAILLAGPAGSPAAPEAPLTWGALVGSGLFTIPDTSTLPRGRFIAGVTIDNRDRDPLGLDLVDGAIAWNRIAQNPDVLMKRGEGLAEAFNVDAF